MPPEVLSDDEVRALLAACGGTREGVRHRALIALLYRAGLRIGEALALHPRDLNLATGEIRILHGKGDRFRIAGIDPGAAAMIEAWMHVRARMTTSRPAMPAGSFTPRPPEGSTESRVVALGRSECGGLCRAGASPPGQVPPGQVPPGQAPREGSNQRGSGSPSAPPARVAAAPPPFAGRCMTPETEPGAPTSRVVGAGTPLPSCAPVFCTREGGSLSDAYIRRLMKRLATKAGLDRRVHAHGLRHTHAAQLRAEGVDIGIISKQLGHRSILTTIRYLDHIAPVQVVKAMREREWQH